MKKFKIVMIASAIVFSVCIAFSTRVDPACADRQQYYKVGNNYYPAGEYASDYACMAGGSVCTYYLANPFNPFSYTPCRYGAYVPIY